MNLTDTFLLAIIVLLTIMLIWLWVVLAMWISRRLRIPVIGILIISVLTGGLGFIILLALALMKEDDGFQVKDYIPKEKEIPEKVKNKQNCSNGKHGRKEGCN